ncbi:MAG: zf-TFIIB domain-containing protein [Candidatus Staskawiczbacteria bacterium]|nr:zf-TFIIB domain-containing protein [Candidatus Staskawiczbacteria bacterium]
MDCPNNHGKLEKILFHSVEVDYCKDCLGIWFDKNELTEAKNEKDSQINWLDIDLWRDKSKFEISTSHKFCPNCRIALSEVKYDESKTKVDFCKSCHGIWLDRGEFKQIIAYLKNKADYEILHHYVENLVKELWEVFLGPEKLREELADFLMVLKLYNYKLAAQYPFLTKLIENAQK